MNPVHISAPQREVRGSTQTLSATVTIDDREWRLWFRTADLPVAAGVEPFLALAVLPAMAVGRSIRSETPASAQLLQGIEQIKARFAEWDSSLADVPVEVSSRPSVDRSSDSRRVASMFSGGVDSFFTLYEHLEEIDDLILVHGFDIRLADTWLRQRTARLLSAVALALGKRLIQVETNIRAFADHYGDWDMHMHGPAIASLAHLLAPNYRVVFVPGERFFDDAGQALSWPVGSNEQTNPLWSAEDVQIVHHGHRHSRPRKIESIGGHDTVRQALRVCYENRRGAYNCGECLKCLVNMAPLRAYGHLDHVRTFGQPLDLDRLVHVKLFHRHGLLRRREYNDHGLEMVAETLAVVERTGSDPELAQALRDCLNDVHYRGVRYFIRRVIGRSKRFGRAMARV